jgi:hypothetical protein
MLLLIAFFALCIGIACLALEISRYGGDIKPPPVPAAMTAPVAPVAHFA